jgi:hypothetical protein
MLGCCAQGASHSFSLTVVVCRGESIEKQQTSTAINTLPATDSVKTSCDPQISIDFNKRRNRVRDQGGRWFRIPHGFPAKHWLPGI